MRDKSSSDARKRKRVGFMRLNPRSPSSQLNKKHESGNIFFALFGAIALVGIIGASTVAIMRGPLSTMVEVQNRTKAESEMAIASRLALLEATELSADGDCDADGFVEPLEFMNAAGAGPTGGGFLPAEVSSARLDPWGTEYGYCAWDAGNVIDFAGTGYPDSCDNGGGSSDGNYNRLSGNGSNTDDTYTIVAIISAGANQTFETTCTGGANPDVAKGGDDIVVEYTYETAVTATNGLWNIKAGEPGVAEIDKEIEVSGNIDLNRGGAGTGQLQLGAGSMIYPDQTVLSICPGIANVNVGLLRMNTSVSPFRLEICDTSGWVSSGGTGIWTAGTGNDIYYNLGTPEVGIGTTTPSHTLEVVGTFDNSGAVTFGSTLDVTGASTLAALNATGAVDFDSTFNVDGASTLAGLTATGAVDFDSTLNVDGASTLAGTTVTTLNATGAVDFDSTLNVDGASTLAGTTVTTLNATDAVDLDSTLNVDGATTLGNTLDAQGAISNSGGNVSINDSLDVVNDLDVNGNADIDGTMEADDYTFGGVDFTPNADCDDATEKITWTATSGWSCSTDENDGSGIGSGTTIAGVFELDAAATPDVIRMKSTVGTGYTDMNFVFGSPQLNDDGDPNHDSRLFFNKTKSALRAGLTEGTQWDNANVGLYSIGLGYYPTASGYASLALGRGATASGVESVAIGSLSGSYGNTSTAIGYWLSASGQNSIALGKRISVNGNQAMGIGLGDIAGTAPIVSANNSFGIFMGDQSGYNLSTTSRMALIGGDFLIDDAGASGSNGCLRYNGATSRLQFSHDCTSWSDMAGSTTVPGADTQVIFNDGGAFGADAGLTYAKATDTLTVGSAIKINGQAGNAPVFMNLDDLGDVNAGAPSDGQCLVYNNGAGEWVSAACTSSGAAVLSGISAAVADNTIANGIYLQNWNWALTGATQDGFTFGETSASINGVGGQSILKATTVPASTAIPMMITNLGNGLSFRVNDDTNDTDTTPFVIDANGNVGVGTATPGSKLHVFGYNPVALSYSNGGNEYGIATSAYETGSGHSWGITTGTTSNPSAGVTALGVFVNNAAGRGAAFGSSSVTTGTLIDIGHSTSAFSGNMMQANLADGSGSFSGNFIRFQNNSDQKFYVADDGEVGAYRYCDEDGNNCFTPASAGGLWTDNTTHITRENIHILDSGQTIDTAGLDGGIAGGIIWDTDNAALRVGRATNTQWDDAAIGAYSSAFGDSSIASEQSSFAAGDHAQAAGYASVALGHYANANGGRAIAIGDTVNADGSQSIAIGKDVDVDAAGAYSMAIGLGDATGASPFVSGANSFGIFMGDQSGYNLSTTNTMALVGGSQRIHNYATSSKLYLDRSNGTAAAPTALSQGDWLGSIIFRGERTSDNTQAGGAFIAAEKRTADTTQTPMDLIFGASYNHGAGIAAYERMRITKDGNIGIGDFRDATDTIDSKFHIQTGDIRLDGGVGNQAGCIRYDDTTDKIQYSHDCSTFADIGSVASGALAINGLSDAYTDYVTNNNFFLGHEGGAGFGANNVSNTSVGVNALDSLDSATSTSGNLGKFNTAVGRNALTAVTNGFDNTAVGSNAGDALTGSGGNVAIGSGSLGTADTSRNTSVGAYALGSSTGSNNTVLGNNAASYLRSGDDNVVLGKYAGRGETTNYTYNGTSNVIIGNEAALNLDANNNQNTIIGASTAATLTGGGSGNILLGYGADVPTTTTSNHLNIGSTIYGDTSAKTVSIGTTLSNSTLTVLNSFNVSNGTNSVGGLRNLTGHGRFEIKDSNGVTTTSLGPYNSGASNYMALGTGLTIGSSATARGVLDLGYTTSTLVVPVGTDAQRPVTPAGGMVRYNTTATPNDKIEYYDAESTSWVQLTDGSSSSLWTDNTTHITRGNAHFIDAGETMTSAGLDGGMGDGFVWNTDKAALRIGTAGSTGWDHTNTGQYSFAHGEGSSASGYNAIGLTGGHGVGSSAIGMMGGTGEGVASLGILAHTQADYSLAFGLSGEINTAGVNSVLFNIGGTYQQVNLPNTFTITGGDFLVGSATMDDAGVAANDNRMFFDKSKGAFRAGSVAGTQWNDANVGTNSFAIGSNSQATGAGSFAQGTSNVSSGGDSFVSGWTSTSSGLAATAQGSTVVASGRFSLAAVKSVTVSGGGSAGFGLRDEILGNTAENSTVSANQAVGFFFGDQSDYNLATTNTFGIVGGTLMVDDAAAGSQGCIRYVEGTGLQFSHDCSTYTTMAGAGGGLWTDNTTHVTRTNFNILNSGQTSDTAGLSINGGGADGRLLIFDPDKMALHGGEISGGSDAFDAANIGVNSFAWGWNAKASGGSSIALGPASNSSNTYTVAIGDQASATGDRAIAIGGSASGQSAVSVGGTASGDYSRAMGRYALAENTGTLALGYGVRAQGAYSVGISAGNNYPSGNVAPIISGTNSVGVFLGVNDGVTMADTETFGIFGGKLSIDDDGTAGSQGCIRYVEGTGLQFSHDCSTYTTMAGAGGGLWTDNTTHITRGNIHILDAGLAAGSTTAGLDGDGTYSFYDPDKAAMRGGTIDSSATVWQDANVGANSLAWGQNSQASGANSFAFGNYARATNSEAFAFGQGTLASGNNSFAGGYNSQATGNNSFAFGETARATAGESSVALGFEATASGDYSFALGLGNAATTQPIVSGASSLGVFMGDQSGINLTTANTMAVLGGDLIVGSYQLDDTTTGNQDNRMFFDLSKGAFRAGIADDDQWDAAYVGNGSVAFGGAAASGPFSFAIGENSSSYASGYGSVKLVAGGTASGSYSFAVGPNANASGDTAIAMGRSVSTTGDYSMAIGLTASAWPYPEVSGTNSFGIFMGDQSSYDLTTSNRMGLVGGHLMIDDAGATGAQGCIRYDGTNSKLQYSHDCTTYADMGAASGMALNDLSDAITAYPDGNMFLGAGNGDNITTGTNNTSLGNNALAVIVDASGTTAIGQGALGALEGGSGNTALGNYAMSAMNGGSDNTAIGGTAGGALLGGNGNTAIGSTVMYAPSTRSYNTAMGFSAMEGGGDGSRNTAIGVYALQSNGGREESTAVGYGAMRYVDSTATVGTTYNTALGYEALRGSTTAADNTGNRNTAIGHTVLTNTTTGGHNTGVGSNSLQLNTEGSNNVAVGTHALGNNTDGYNNVAIGEQTLTSNSNGASNTAVGRYALNLATGNNNTAIGDGAGDSITTGSGNIIIGYDIDAPVATANSQLNIGNTIYGDLANDYVGIGNFSSDTIDSTLHLASGDIRLDGGADNQAGCIRYDDTTDKLQYSHDCTTFADMGAASGMALNDLSDSVTDYTTDHNMFIGSGTGANIAVGGQQNISLGQNAAAGLTTGDNNVAIGYNAAAGITVETDTIAIGANALANNPGLGSMAIGTNALRYATGDNNIGLGYEAGTNIDTGYRNTAIGTNARRYGSGLETVALGHAAGAGTNGVTTGVDNSVFIGHGAGNNITTGDNNTYVGHQAGDSVTTGSDNILIGYGVDTPAATTSNHLNIGNTIYGDLSTDYIGIGTASPSDLLTISGDNGEFSHYSFSATAGSGGDYQLKRARGTEASPTNVITGDKLGGIRFMGYGASTWQTGAYIYATTIASPGNSATDMPTKLDFGTTTNGTAISTKMTLDDLGRIGIGDETPDAQLEVSGNGGLINTDSIFMLSTNDNNDGDIFVVKNDGDVGIGIAAPTRPLHVEGDIAYNPLVRLRNSNGNGISGLELRDSSDDFKGVVGQFSFDYDGVTQPLGIVSNDNDIVFVTGDDGSNPGTVRMRIDAANGYIGIGNTVPTVALDVTGDIEYTGTITDVSDMRLKDNIKPLTETGSLLERIDHIDTYSFSMKDDKTHRTEYGVMAQELEKIFPELVHTAKDEMGTKSVNYVGLIAPMIEGMKELKAQNAALQSAQADTNKAIEDLGKQVALLNDIAGNNVGKASTESYWMLLLGLLGGIGFMLVIQRRKA